MAKIIDDPSIKTLRKLLNQADEQFRVPLYQRDYAWQEDQIDDFAADIFSLVSQRTEHFFGTLVLADDSPGADYEGQDEIRYVIDGQQRLTTSLLLLSVIRHRLAELGDRNHGRLLLSTSLSVNHEPKLYANRDNQKFLSPLLDGTLNSTAEVAGHFNQLPDSIRAKSERLFKAYERLRNHVLEQALRRARAETSDHSASEVQFLSDLANSLLQQSLFVEINVQSWQDSFAVFEGLNNRGLDLSEQDLVKNALLARAHSEDSARDSILEYERQWGEISGRVAGTKFSRFLRHYLLLHYQDVPLKRVVRQLNSHFGDSDADEMVAALDSASRSYQRITQPSRERHAGLREALSNLKELEAERSYPVVLAVLLSGIAPQGAVEILREVESLYFRRSAILGRDNKALEADFQTIAHNLYLAGESGVSDAAAAIKTLKPSDEEVLQQFRNRSKMRPSTAKFMLRRIEKHLRGGVLDATNNPTLEHILPQNPSLWDLSHSEAASFHSNLDRLGNLTLLRGSDNSALGNAPFSEKKKHYRSEGLRLNDPVVESESWGTEEIDKRQQWLARLSIEIW